MSPGPPLLDAAAGPTSTAGSDASGAPLVIAHVLAPAPFGGLERVVIGLAAGQAARGHRVYVVAVVAPEDGEHPFVDQARAAGIDVVVLPLPGRAYLRERREVRDLCRRLGVQVVHTHGYRPDVIAGSAARALRTPVVTTVHGFCGGGWRNRAYEWMQTVAYRRCDAVVAVSHKLAGELERAGVPGGRIHVVRNGWAGGLSALPRDEARRELEIQGDAFRLGWIGRASHEKGLDVMIEALPLVADLPIALSVVGDGPDRPRLEARAAELGVAARIRWHGMVRDAGRLVSAFDAFVLSSRTEGTPMALLEAMAARLPVVATAVGGVPEVVSPAEALLTPPEDPPALAAAIRVFADDPGSAATRAEAAHTRLQHEFGSNAWLDRYDAIYVEALHPERTPRA